MALVEDLFKLPRVIFGVWDFRSGVIIPEYTTATRPDATKSKRMIIWVTDGGVNGVPTPMISDGTNWRRLIMDVASSPTYTVTNLTVDRTYDANATSVNELADVLGTLLQDLGKS